MSGLVYKVFINDGAFFDFPRLEDDTLSIAPFQTRTPDFTGVASDFQNYNDTAQNFATYQCTPENTSGFNYFNISLQGSLYTGDRPGVYRFVFAQNGLNNDDLTFFYFGDSALSPTLTNYSQKTTFSSGSDNQYTTPFLRANTFYPILLYYGQSFGGAYLALGLVPPGEEAVDFSPSALVPIILKKCPADDAFRPIGGGGARYECTDRQRHQPIGGSSPASC